MTISAVVAGIIVAGLGILGTIWGWKHSKFLAVPCICVIVAIIGIVFFFVGLTTPASSGSHSYSTEYDMPNESDKSASDYIKRVDPDLYNDMKNRYDNLK